MYELCLLVEYSNFCALALMASMSLMASMILMVAMVLIEPMCRMTPMVLISFRTFFGSIGFNDFLFFNPICCLGEILHL